MASKTTGKAQGRSRPQAQNKESKQKQSKASPESGRGGSGSGGAKGAANGTAARKGGGEQRGQERNPQQQRKTRPEAREQSSQQDEGAQDQAQQGQNEGQEQSQEGGGNITKVAQTAKQHPVTTAASIAGLTLLAAQGLRMAINSMSGNGASAMPGGASREASADEDEAGEQDDEDSPEASYEEDEEGDEGSEEDDDSPQASAEDEGDESDEDEADEDEQEGAGISGRFRGIGSALRSSGGAIRRGAASGYERGREAAGQNWQSHPLVMCGLAIAVGAAAGLLLPSTRQEDQWMGESSDKVTGRLKKTGKQFFRQGRQIAGKVVSEAVNTTAKEVEREGLTPDRLGKKVKRVVSSVREAVSNAVQED